jgi:ubiquinone/menaquinone biosynthesis C-methylase UbiE
MAWSKRDYDNDPDNLKSLRDVHCLEDLVDKFYLKGKAYASRKRKMQNILENIKDLKGNCLELAFGFGTSIYVLLETYPNLTIDTFDFSESVSKLIPMMRKYHGPRLRHLWIGRCENIPVRDNTYDFINSQSIFERLNEAQYNDTVKECFRVLKPNGMMGVWVDQSRDGDTQHIRVRSHESTAKEITKFGFKKITNHIFRKI